MTEPITDCEPSTCRLDLPGVSRGEFLTVCSASGSVEQAQSRARRFPSACAEEMEGFAVARAARAAGVPFTCVRAVSNLVGDRDVSAWRFREGMQALADGLAELAS